MRKEGLLSVREYAEENGVTGSAVRQRIYSGDIPESAIEFLDGRRFIRADFQYPTCKRPGPKARG